ncbi:unnamed protein product [Chilo suppressalis]|uniref:Uncharacterized protein n=1 Tax=Chilo suppressalis TaxID=168631 RepID=A0ABN8B6F3_CHISP|nr:unnamed protein product [Chilo suppressalis]
MMRSTQRRKNIKNACKHKVNKKKRYRSRSALGCVQNISILDLENINEVLRVYKTQRAEGKGAWKVVPKDSCEVYKNRRKRQAESSHHNEDNDESGRSTDSDNENKTGAKKPKRNGVNVKKEPLRKTKRRRKLNKHRRSQQRSDSTSISTTTMYSSCFSSSEMDYDDD